METTTDYDLPIDWEAMSDEERNEWFQIERARRQFSGQSLVSVEERLKVQRRREG